ncbi:MAG: hypothetical protein Q4C77_12865 [Eubacteriales bacterium]|nr:hypothetical protein [Eubacteriales bacterium]
MRKLFYSISVFLFLGLLTLGYYETYRIADMRDRIWLMENAGTGQDSDAADETQTEAFVENGEIPGDAVMADGNRENRGYGSYYLIEQEGFLTVCLSDQKTVFETTSIRISSLPESLQKEIRDGKYLKDQQELYSFLENYSS